MLTGLLRFPRPNGSSCSSATPVFSVVDAAAAAAVGMTWSAVGGAGIADLCCCGDSGGNIVSPDNVDVDVDVDDVVALGFDVGEGTD